MDHLSALPDRVQGTLAYRKAIKHPEHELLDACGETWVNAPADSTDLTAERLGSAPLGLSGFREGERLPHGGTVLKEIRGMGKVCDWRTSPWTPSNGGKIRPLVFVQHIPVVPNTVGIGDFVVLRDVLVAQGLMVQAATDREGNVALFTPLDQLCYQARGANQVSCGAEHMHASISEAWTKHQMRAAAWLAQLAERKHGIPARGGKLGAGAGVVRVLKRGHVTHEAEARKAGYNDRIDPGPGFDWAYLWHCVSYFKQHGHMANA